MVSTTCLFIVLGGTSYAALKITGKDVKRETLTGANVKDGSLLRKDFRKGQLPRGHKGQSGAQGSPGTRGAPGPQGAPAPTGTADQAPPAPVPIGQRLTINRLSGPPIVFPVLSSSFGGSQEGTTGGGGGGGSGKAAYEDLVVAKPPDASAGELLDEEVEGTHFPSAKLEYFAPGSSSASATIELGETFITDFANSGSGDARALTTGSGAPEALTLGYRSIEQGIPGPGGSELKSCWDLLLNTDCG